jgi:CBS domain-containing protein
MPTVVEELMSPRPTALKESDDLGVARALLLHQRIRHLPVVKAGRLVGLVTSQSLLRADAELGERLASTRPVSEVMIKKVETVRRHTPARRAARLMVDLKIGCLPVVEADGTLVGIVTESDLIRFASDAARDLDAATTSIFRAHDES